MNKTTSVSSLNQQIKAILETTFLSVSVEGEISNLTYHSSGHIYFSLKDNSSSIKALMWKGNAKYLKFRLEEGQKVILHGSISLYSPRGDYQLIASKIEPSGVGSLALAYEQLKSKLLQKGYFLDSNKKQLPKIVNSIALVTSATGAAVEDMKRVASNRWPLVKMIIIDTIVQGESSASSIVNSISLAHKQSVDVIIVGRGGGSIEDLWGFNEEIVADVIFNATIPIISAVGHESDFLISDLVADVRASTPSNAIELLLPDMNNYRIYIDELRTRLNKIQENNIYNFNQTLQHIKQQFQQNSVLQKIAMQQSSIKNIKISLNIALEQIINSKQNSIALLKNSYTHNNPQLKSKDGFAQLVKNNNQITLHEVKIDDTILLQTPNIEATVKVIDKRIINNE